MEKYVKDFTGTRIKEEELNEALKHTNEPWFNEIKDKFAKCFYFTSDPELLKKYHESDAIRNQWEILKKLKEKEKLDNIFHKMMENPSVFKQ